MTREELEKKRGIKLSQKRTNPAETLIVSADSVSPKKSNTPKENDNLTASSPKKSSPAKNTVKSKNEPKHDDTPSKRGPGKPKKRKPGDKQISFWLDEDLVPGLFKTLSYGDSVGACINEIIRNYQKKNNLYQK